MGWNWISLSHSSSTHCRTLNSQRYISQVLEPVVLPYLLGLATVIFQQDNAQPHVVRTVNPPDCIVSMVASSPDILPIENM
ncbi:hypothetical protein TNCV_204791 [Trichonephila clavipes]|nr:hypothetical protein TNCV_204791 [Trichonephila clavipes]